ncbi:MAG: hypothetical protein H0W61_17000 [Bacteroidetes bacterium]|nr:hypothetical protein [Bacteroidota bacterium]
MIFKERNFLAFCFFIAGFAGIAQDDLLGMVEDKTPQKPQKVFATFKTYRLGNALTTEPVKKKHLDFRISHRFGNIYDANNPNAINETFQSYLGFDNASDIRNSFDYGLTDNITIGIGRSRMNKLVDGSVKWRFLQQTTDFSIPVSMALFADVGYTHAHTSDIYSGIVKDFPTNEAHRVNYFTELIIASKINDWLSLELLPAYVYRNFIKENINTSNKATDENGFLSIGFGGRIKLTKRCSFIGDYYYNTSKFYNNNSDFKNPLSLGFELETGGHVFSLFFTNAAGLIDNNFIPYTRDSWGKGQVKFGFSISRVFAL